jgi:hypothetical protein
MYAVLFMFLCNSLGVLTHIRSIIGDYWELNSTAYDNYA